MVYRARDPRMGRDVAIKVLPASVALDRDRLHRFEQEARAAGTLNHPNIVTVHDFGDADGTTYIVSELLEGQTLRAGIEAASLGGGQRGLPARRVTDVARQLAAGLAAAHERGIVHRDLKPENVFLLPDGRVKILDFGLAKLRDTRPVGAGEHPTQAVSTLSPAWDVSTRTGPGVVLGTIGYMAPEQVRGDVVDHRADIFALGVMLFEMLSGRRPFEGDTPVDTLHAILRGEAPALETLGVGVPPELSRIVQHCLEKRPDDRFQSARDLAFHLAGAATISGTRDATGLASGERSATSAGVTSRRLPWAIASIASLAAVVATVMVLSSRQNPVQEQSALEQGPVVSHILPPAEVVAVDRSFALSPDGDMLAFPGRSRDGIHRLWLRDMRTGQARMVASSEDAAFPFWSPDGRELMIFAKSKLKRVRREGGAAQTHSEAPYFADIRGGLWLLDDSIVFGWDSGPLMRGAPAGGLPTEWTSLARPEGGLHHLWPALMPDGKSVAFGVENRDSEKSGVYMSPLDMSQPPEPLLLSPLTNRWHVVATQDQGLL
jgi:serine/threonine protein kinase